MMINFFSIIKFFLRVEELPEKRASLEGDVDEGARGLKCHQKLFRIGG